MWKDEIVEETRREREAHASRFNYDLEAMYRDLKEKNDKASVQWCHCHPSNQCG